MKRFVKELVVFVLFLFVVMIAVDCAISSGLRKTTIRKFAVWNDIYNRNNLDNDLVVLGSSCAWCSYNTYIMDSMLNCNSYNLGIDGHAWDYYLIRYNTYRRFSSQPKTIIIDIDVGAMGNSADSQYEREQFFPYFFDDSLVSLVKDDKEFSLFDRKCPLIRYFGYRDLIDNGILSFFGKQQFEDDGLYKGFRGNEYPSDESSFASIDRMLMSNDSVSVKSIMHFIDEMDSLGTKVCMVKIPTYFKLLNRCDNLTVMNSLYDSIANSTKAILFDYWNSPICYDSTCFYNCSHLNKKGSELFTTKLCHDIDSLQLLN